METPHHGPSLQTRTAALSERPGRHVGFGGGGKGRGSGVGPHPYLPTDSDMEHLNRLQALEQSLFPESAKPRRTSVRDESRLRLLLTRNFWYGGFRLEDAVKAGRLQEPAGTNEEHQQAHPIYKQARPQTAPQAHVGLRSASALGARRDFTKSTRGTPGGPRMGVNQYARPASALARSSSAPWTPQAGTMLPHQWNNSQHRGTHHEDLNLSSETPRQQARVAGKVTTDSGRTDLNAAVSKYSNGSRARPQSAHPCSTTTFSPSRQYSLGTPAGATGAQQAQAAGQGAGVPRPRPETANPGAGTRATGPQGSGSSSPLGSRRSSPIPGLRIVVPSDSPGPSPGVLTITSTPAPPPAAPPGIPAAYDLEQQRPHSANLHSQQLKAKSTLRPFSALPRTTSFRPASAASRVESMWDDNESIYTVGSGDRAKTKKEISYLSEAQGHGSSTAPSVKPATVAWADFLQRDGGLRSRPVSAARSLSAQQNLQLRVPAALGMMMDTNSPWVDPEKVSFLPEQIPSPRWTPIELSGQPSGRQDAVRLAENLIEGLSALEVEDAEDKPPTRPHFDLRRMMMVQHSMGELLDQVGTHCVERANTLGLLWSQMVDEFERMLAVQDSIVAKHVAALQEAKLTEGELRLKLKRQTDEVDEMRESMRIMQLSEEHVRAQLYEAESFVQQKVSQKRWVRSKQRPQDEKPTKDTPGDQNPMVNNEDHELDSPVSPPPKHNNQVVDALMTMDELQFEANITYKEQVRIKALKKWAPMIKELTRLASDNHKQLTVLRGIGINQEIDKLSQLLDDSGNVSIHAIIQRMPVEEIAVILGSLGSINPMRAADMMKMLPISEAASVLLRISAFQRGEIMKALGSDLVCSMLSTGTPEEAADVLKGINADDMGKLLMFMRPQDAADVMAAMGEDETSTVFQHIPDESAARILRDLPPKAGATAVKKLPTLRTANLFSAFPNDAAAGVLGSVTPRTVASVLGHFDDMKGAGILSKLSAAHQREVSARMELEDIERILLKLSSNESSLVFLALTDERRAAVMRVIAKSDVKASGFISALVEYLLLLDKFVLAESHRKAVDNSASQPTTAVQHPPQAGHAPDALDAKALVERCHMALATALGELSAAAIAVVMRSLDKQYKVRMLNALGEKQRSQLMVAVEANTSELVGQLLVELAVEAPDLVVEAATALGDECVLKLVVGTPLIEQSHVMACLNVEQAFTIVGMLRKDQQEALTVCMEMHHPRALGLWREYRDEVQGVVKQKKPKRNAKVALTGWDTGKKGKKKGKGKGKELLPFRQVPKEEDSTAKGYAKPDTTQLSSSEMVDATDRIEQALKKAAPSWTSALLSKWAPTKMELTFNPRDVRLQQYLIAAKKFKAGKLDWLLDIIQRLYLDKARRDQHLVKVGLSRMTMPDALLVFLHSEADLTLGPARDDFASQTQVMRSACTIMLTIIKFEEKNFRIKAFSRFLSEEWGLDTLDKYIEAESLCMLSHEELPVGKWNHYDTTTGKGKDPEVCLEKCAMLAEMLLGKRSLATTASFIVVLKSAATLASEKDLQQFIELHKSSPTTDLMKLKMGTFMFHVCEEYVRCELVLQMHAVTEVFKGWDITVNGRLSQHEVMNMSTAMLHTTGDLLTSPKSVALKIWKHAWAADASVRVSCDDAAGPEGPGITLQGFRASLKHVAVVRDYIRLIHTPPAQVPTPFRLLENLDRFLHALTLRHHRQFTSAFDGMFDQTESAEPVIRLYLGKAVTAQNGSVSLRWYLQALQHMSNQVFDRLFERVRKVEGREVDSTVHVNDWMIAFDDDVRQVESGIQMMYGFKGLVIGSTTAKHELELQLQSAPPFLRSHVRIQRLRLFAALRKLCEHQASSIIAQRWKTGKQRASFKVKMTKLLTPSVGRSR